MKAISMSAKAALVASALTANSASNATVRYIEMSAEIFFPAAGGPFQMIGFTGTWDDVSNQGIWTGTAAIPGFKTTAHYTQTFTMDESTGIGTLNRFDVPTCTDNTGGSACLGLTDALSGSLISTAVNPPSYDAYKNAVPFNPADGWTGQWTLQINRVRNNPDGSTFNEYTPMPFDVTIVPPVPVPAAAWLFGSGLLGLIGSVRRRRAS